MINIIDLRRTLDCYGTLSNPNDALTRNNELYSQTFKSLEEAPSSEKRDYRIALRIIEIAAERIQDQLNNPEETA